MKTQFLKRRTDVPFIFQGITLTETILALKDIRIFAGTRDATVIIEAGVYTSETAMQANSEDVLRTFQFTLTRENIVIKEIVGFNVVKQTTITDSNVTSLNLPQELSTFTFDLDFKGGMIFSDAGLQLLLQMPSPVEGRMLGDEWEIPQIQI